MNRTTRIITFIGETRIVSYEATTDVADAFSSFMSQFDMKDGRIVDDKQWDQFYATLTVNQISGMKLLKESSIGQLQAQS